MRYSPIAEARKAWEAWLVTAPRSVKALIFLLLVAAVPVGEAGAGEQGREAECGDSCGWPSRGDPEDLLQASRCADRSPSEAGLAVRSGILLRLDELPDCLRPAFVSLADAVAASVGERPRKAVVRARIARQYYEASAYYQPGGLEVVYMPSEIAPIMDVLQREWPDYVSAEGDLGWSGFLLVLDGEEVRVRVMEDELRPGDIWLHSEEIIGEFFPGLAFQPMPR